MAKLMACRDTASSAHPTKLVGSQGRSARGTHMPEKSGVPSAVLGDGAVKFGEPSALRGTPGVGRCSHWAVRGIDRASVSSVIRMLTMIHDLPFSRVSLMN